MPGRYQQQSRNDGEGRPLVNKSRQSDKYLSNFEERPDADQTEDVAAPFVRRKLGPADQSDIYAANIEQDLILQKQKKAKQWKMRFCLALILCLAIIIVIVPVGVAVGKKNHHNKKQGQDLDSIQVGDNTTDSSIEVDNSKSKERSFSDSSETVKPESGIAPTDTNEIETQDDYIAEDVEYKDDPDYEQPEPLEPSQVPNDNIVVLSNEEQGSALKQMQSKCSLSGCHLHWHLVMCTDSNTTSLDDLMNDIRWYFGTLVVKEELLGCIELDSNNGEGQGIVLGCIEQCQGKKSVAVDAYLEDPENSIASYLMEEFVSAFINTANTVTKCVFKHPLGAPDLMNEHSCPFLKTEKGDTVSKFENEQLVVSADFS